ETKQSWLDWIDHNKLIISVILTAPLLLAHLFMVFGIHTPLMTNGWLQFAMATPVFLIGATYFGRSAWSGIRLGFLNMDVLIFLGATAAFVYSLNGLYWNDTHYYFFETAPTIITMVLGGDWMEARAVSRTTSALEALDALQVESALRIMPSGTLVKVPVEELTPGQMVQVNTGDRIPLDGTIIHGNGLVDASMLTGESLAIDIAKGDHVYGGTVLVQGQFQVEINTYPKDSTLARMIELVKTAQRDKPQIQRLADRVSNIFVPVVISISVLTFFLGWLTGYATPSQAIMNAIAVLLISCPCAMGLATPTAVMVGVGRLARLGIMIKGGAAVEELAQIR
ncbi:MAG: HAD-IC family P-type ATPase, partial [Bacteroidota bacterium]